MRRTLYVSSVSILAALLSLGVGCAGPDQDAASAQRAAVMAACHLNDGTIDDNDDLRACEPGNTKKTTICHVPPGNPANAHTLCIGNPAVSPHIHHHGDYVGPCKAEIPCTPPPSTGNGGQSGGDQSGTGGTTPGTGGTTPGTGGTAGSGGEVVIP
jgi:hypothetical protein